MDVIGYIIGAILLWSILGVVSTFFRDPLIFLLGVGFFFDDDCDH